MALPAARTARQLVLSSHVELDNAPELNTGDPVELGAQYRDLRDRFPSITVRGGCGGNRSQSPTESRMSAQIWFAMFQTSAF